MRAAGVDRGVGEDGFTLSQNFADANQLYSLFPVRSHNGTMTNNEAQNTTKDSSLYVGQSDHVTIMGNMAHDNLLGLEIENSSDVTAKNNQLFNNTAGLIADVNAGLQKKDQVNVLIADNSIHDNNRPNSASEGDSEGGYPARDGHGNSRRLHGDRAEQHDQQQRFCRHHRRELLHRHLGVQRAYRH